MIREDVTLLSPVVVDQAAPIAISESAAAKLREVIAAKNLESAGLRVFVSGGGCSGLQYGMAFETAGGEEDDLRFHVHGLQVYIDPISSQYMQGASIDYVDSLMGGGFKIENPNAQSSCGCGTSFKPKGEEGGAQASQPQGGGCGCH